MNNKAKFFDLLIFGAIILALIIIIPKSNKGKTNAGNKENKDVLYSAMSDSLFIKLFEEKD